MSPQKHGVKRHPSTPSSPFKRSNVRRRKLNEHIVYNKDQDINKQIPKLNQASSSLSTNPPPSSPNISNSFAISRQLYLQQFQIERLTDVVKFLESERNISS